MMLPLISETSSPIFLKLGIVPTYMPRLVSVKFEKISFTNKNFYSKNNLPFIVISKTSTLVKKLVLRYMSKMIYVKFEKIPFTNKNVL